MTAIQVPSVEDLRVEEAVKLCYICREEERYDQPEEPPRAWVHPCSCTLVAHESCLLQWIQTAEQNPSRDALKCPQCGTHYELESDNPFILRVLDNLNNALLRTGQLVLIANFATGVAGLLSGVYVVCTAYGAYAVQEFLGKEMFDLLLTDDPSNWPWHAYLNLPLIPLSLILSRTSMFDAVLPTVPLFLAWPTSQPIQTAGERLHTSRWSLFRNGEATHHLAPPRLSLFTWPPGPVFSVLLFPLTRRIYNQYFTRFSHWVLDTTPAPRPAAARRLVWRLGDDGGAPLRIQIGANIEARRQQRQQLQQLQQQGAQEQGVPEAAADDDGEATTRLAWGSFGRLIGGALLIPAISNFMGSLLYRLSKHSLILRRILAVRPPLNGAPPPLTSGPGAWKEGSPRQLADTAKVVLSIFLGGTRTWAERDPVWWRNSIGLGLFSVAKDCVELYYLWLKKRELESRRVKSRSFEGIDVRELDLVNPPE